MAQETIMQHKDVASQVENQEKKVVSRSDVIFNEKHYFWDFDYKSPRGFKTSVKFARIPIKLDDLIQKPETTKVDSDMQPASRKFFHTIDGCQSYSKTVREDGSEVVGKLQDAIKTEDGKLVIAVKDEMTKYASNKKNLKRADLVRIIPDKLFPLIVSPEQGTYEAKKVWKDLVDSMEIAYIESFCPWPAYGGTMHAVLYPVGNEQNFGFILMTWGALAEIEQYLMVEEGPIITAKSSGKKGNVQTKLGEI